MPTLNWIHETAIDRYYETGIKESTSNPITFSCRHCSKIFKTIQLRDLHELEHPIRNPQLTIHGKELIGKEYTITSELSPKDIRIDFAEHIEVNGEISSLKDLQKILSQETNKFFKIVFSNNETPEKKINIHICISDKVEIGNIDSYFKQYFSCDDFSGKEIEKFRIDTEKFDSARNYASGLVAYLHGIMAKDQRTERIKYEDFASKFNEAYSFLKNYDTNLSMALRSIISFNKNSFKETSTGLLTLDQAISFFNNNQFYVKRNYSTNDEATKLPVDASTAFIVDDLINYFPKMNLKDIENKINHFNVKFISQQDRSKLKFIAFIKAKDEGNQSKIDAYCKSLKNDSIFLAYHEKKK